MFCVQFPSCPFSRMTHAWQTAGFLRRALEHSGRSAVHVCLFISADRTRAQTRIQLKSAALVKPSASGCARVVNSRCVVGVMQSVTFCLMFHLDFWTLKGLNPFECEWMWNGFYFNTKIVHIFSFHANGFLTIHDYLISSRNTSHHKRVIPCQLTHKATFSQKLFLF